MASVAEQLASNISFSAFKNATELKQRIWFTLLALLVYRFGTYLPLPGINIDTLRQIFEQNQSGIIGIFNMFAGGAVGRMAILSLGIMPYITSSIIIQLVVPVVPRLNYLKKEGGEQGRRQINQYTRYGTVFLATIQAWGIAVGLEGASGVVIDPGLFFKISAVITLVGGTIFLMWLGEQITQRGIGNGISLLITVGILADLPKALSDAYALIFMAPDEDNLVILKGVLMVGLFLIVVAGIIAVTQAQRKIPVQYAKRMVGRKVFGGQSSFLPLKVNYAGVMPVIFASAILMFPAQLLRTFGAAFEQDWAIDLANVFASRGWFYYLVYGGLILVFSYFWVSIMFKPVQIADDLKKNGGYVPGVRPGEHTAKFLDFVMTRLTLAGAIFLTIIAVFPDFIFKTANVSYNVATFFGGTGMLIIVGVVLDTMRQVETFLLQRHYDGFLRKGRIKGRSTNTGQGIESLELKDFEAQWRPLLLIAGALFTLGFVSLGIMKFVLN